MKKLAGLLLLLAIIQGCKKDKDKETDNEDKVTITNGVWGNVTLTEGNCMPVIVDASKEPYVSTCKTYGVKRTVQIYEFTTIDEAEPRLGYGSYDRFKTQLIKELESDTEGFFQTELPAGQYTIVIIENGKLYARQYGNNGINPVTHTGGRTQFDININKASY
jgi:hypothetical protein